MYKETLEMIENNTGIRFEPVKKIGLFKYVTHKKPRKFHFSK